MIKRFLINGGDAVVCLKRDKRPTGSFGDNVRMRDYYSNRKMRKNRCTFDWGPWLSFVANGNSMALMAMAN